MGLQILLAKLVEQLSKDRKLLTVVSIVIGAAATVILFLAEGWGNNFRDWVDYLSWITGTVTTTGFTAMPQTFWGRLWDGLLKIPLFVLSLGVLGMFLVWGIERTTKTRRGQSTYKGDGHVLVIGWSKITTRLCEKYRGRYPVVTIDQTLEEIPDGVDFFIRGAPSDDTTLLRAGADRAALAIIGLPHDGITGLTAASVRRLNSQCRIVTVAIEVENIDRLGEISGTEVLCAVQRIAGEIVKAIGGAAALVFGTGPIVNRLHEIARETCVFDDGDPAVDADLIEAQVASYNTVVVAARDDNHTWLAVSSVRAQAPQAKIVAVMENAENEIHLRQAGANSVFCPTTIL